MTIATILTPAQIANRAVSICKGDVNDTMKFRNNVQDTISDISVSQSLAQRAVRHFNKNFLKYVAKIR
tara:strand:+ start:416 stop:619 length:204 start_codon:yes stop_codon:yes gene_type:complete